MACFKKTYIYSYMLCFDLLLQHHLGVKLRNPPSTRVTSLSHHALENISESHLETTCLSENSTRTSNAQRPKRPQFKSYKSFDDDYLKHATTTGNDGTKYFDFLSKKLHLLLFVQKLTH